MPFFQTHGQRVGMIVFLSLLSRVEIVCHFHCVAEIIPAVFDMVHGDEVVVVAHLLAIRPQTVEFANPAIAQTFLANDFQHQQSPNLVLG